MENACLGGWSGLKFAIIFSSDLDTFYEILRLLEKRGGTVHYRRGPSIYIDILRHNRDLEEIKEMLKELRRREPN